MAIFLGYISRDGERMIYDKIIIGAGLYGLYAARFCGHKGERVLVLEYDPEPFMRATYINQARVHMGYHYPRSFSTAIKSAHYFDRFNDDFGFCVHSVFDQVYATSEAFSWTDAEQFRQFCCNADIRCDEVPVSWYFKDGVCDGAFLTEEYTYDAKLLKEFFLQEIKKLPNVEIRYGVRIGRIVQHSSSFSVYTANEGELKTDFLLNATYASTNQIIAKIEGVQPYTPIRIKYELCEIILCEVNDKLNNVGITVMDGPFFSIMPFGKTGLHSLTSVTFTPHVTSYTDLPDFQCQRNSGTECSDRQLGNCNSCRWHPESAWPYMSQMAHKYLKDDFIFAYKEFLFSMKPILQASEIDDSRPTVIRQLSDTPKLISVLSGKINTVYDLDEVLS